MLKNTSTSTWICSGGSDGVLLLYALSRTIGGPYESGVLIKTDRGGKLTHSKKNRNKNDGSWKDTKKMC